MKRLRIIALIALSIVIFSCQKVFLGKDPENTPRSNFESLWNTIDKKYSFFDYKHIDWDSIYNVYSPQVNNSLDNLKLFNIFFKMLSDLRDAHVNLVAPFNISRYESIFTESPVNYDETLVSIHYLRSDYFITGPFKHQFIENGTIGYIRYASFANYFSASDVDFMINRFKDTKGIIIDVRNNGGGYISDLETLCSRFCDRRQVIYISIVKNGPKHNDFSTPEKVYISPSSFTYSKPVCVLTNRGSYSATSFFVLAMRNFPNVTIVGDSTGGGLGAPTGAELPNGWYYRFSSTQTLSPIGENFENGVPPDILVDMKSTDLQRGIDTIIETAIEKILSKS